MSASAVTDAPRPAADDAPDHVEPTMLFGFWYRAIESRALERGRTTTVTVLGAALFLGRDSRGGAFALHDACPHRGMPFSHGRFDGDRVECGFHGWKFDVRTGQCQSIPACTDRQRIKLASIRAGRVPCEERDGWVWVYMAEPPGARPRAGVVNFAHPPSLPVFSERYRHFDITGEVGTAADHFMTLLVDAAHGPFVHRRWWVLARILFGLFGVEERSGWIDEVHINYEPLPFGYRESFTSQVPDRWVHELAGSDTMTVEVDFLLPTVRVGRIRFGKFWLTSLQTVTPIGPTRSRVDQRVAWEAFYWTPLATRTMQALFWIFFAQDRVAMERQAEGLPRIRRLMFVDDFDRPARWYYDLKRAWLESRRSGTELKHPLTGPVTLKWRNASLDGS